MGKIRISKLGTEDENLKRQKAKIKREQKEKRKTHLSGMKGGEKLVDMSISEDTSEPKDTSDGGRQARSARHDSSEVDGKKKPLHTHGKTYLAAKKLVDPARLYSPAEALELVKKTSLSKFDGSVEAHLNCLEKGLRGQVFLPHGIGKEVRVAIATDQLIEKINTGKIDFDILVATPLMMPKLARVAKVLGPRGLMPNPKSGTISDKPEELAKKFSSGATQFKTETDFPIIHFVLGKVSFSVKDLEENLQALLSAVGVAKIKSIFLKATMGPSVKVKI